jgi:aminoglycoside 3-N-acetyltransferase I
MTSTAEIQVLQSRDAPLLREMLALFGEAFDDSRSYAGAPPSEAYLEKLLGGDSFVAVAALKMGSVVGGLAGYELRKFEQERSEFYIYDLAVAEPHRRMGVATALIAAFKRIAAARGGWVIFVQADYGDDPAIALYTKLGMREDVLHFDIPVG